MRTVQASIATLVLCAATPCVRAQGEPAVEPAGTAAATPTEQTAAEPASQPASPAAAAPTGFEGAAADVDARLAASLAELKELRERIAAEKIPLGRRLAELEAELSAVRQEAQKTSRTLDGRALDLSNLRSRNEARREETRYLSNLLGDYVREFESRLHIAELQRYEDVLDAARLAPEDDTLPADAVFRTQLALLTTSLERLDEAAGGARFEGAAVDGDGLIRRGSFLEIGPAVLFRSDDGAVVGSAEQRLGSLEPSAIGFGRPEDALAAGGLVASGEGFFPLDPTLGDAHRVEATEEPLIEHIKKGGTVMIPIFAMAGVALLIALYKWIALAFVRKPSRRKVDALLAAVADGNEELAAARARDIRGPGGRMLVAGVDHVREPRELIEEVMYETVLTTRLKLNRMLPFIAICAASAPLLGLLGTVTGIIDTFKMMTVFGSGDVKALSGGISKALITTEFGLIVAIPSLLLHAFLSRKARAIVGSMETAAVAFANQVQKSPFARRQRTALRDEVLVPSQPDPDRVRAHVNEILKDLLGSMVEDDREAEHAGQGAG